MCSSLHAYGHYINLSVNLIIHLMNNYLKYKVNVGRVLSMTALILSKTVSSNLNCSLSFSRDGDSTT